MAKSDKQPLSLAEPKSYEEFVASRRAYQQRIQTLKMDMDMHKKGQSLLETMLDGSRCVKAQWKHAQDEYGHMQAQLQALEQQQEEELMEHLQALHARVDQVRDGPEQSVFEHQSQESQSAECPCFTDDHNVLFALFLDETYAQDQPIVEGVSVFVMKFANWLKKRNFVNTACGVEGMAQQLCCWAQTQRVQLYNVT
jgi:hypothetical protein